LKRIEDIYKKKINDIVKKKLPYIVANENILENPDKKIKVKIPILEEPYFKPHYSSDSKGSGGLDSGNGKGQPGESSADYVVEAEFSVDEIAELIFEQLGLPKLKPKKSGEEIDEIKVNGISKTGPMSRIHRRKTLQEIIKKSRVTKDDLRYRDLRVLKNPILKAVIYLARDFSGSMTEEKKYKVRSASFWILKFLEKNYPFVKLKFVLHDTEAFFSDEDTFFKANTGGGTRISSAFKLIYKDIKEIDDGETNFYVFYFSDGENEHHDNLPAVEFIEKLNTSVNMLGYTQVTYSSNYLYTGMYDYLFDKILEIEKKKRNLENVKISIFSSVKQTLLTFFGDAIDG
jgi:uncharacterized sporulation protein YeaH/YhbH (DUF444 family)